MKILILGNDGYIGYPLTIHLLKLGHEITGVDNFSRRKRVNGVESESLTPITPALSRRYYLGSRYKNFDRQEDVTLGVDGPWFIKSIVNHVQPDAIIHLAEQSSAPWSMISSYKASKTQLENVIGTLHLLWAMKEECPDAHLIKLGSLGEYGTPNCDIPEGEIPKECIGGSEDFQVDGYGQLEHTEVAECPMSSLPFPRSPNSFYHLSKVHDTHNIIFACKNWNLRSTDIMQGIVFGLNNPDSSEEITRFDYDEYFGTVINRFCVQALINHPFTIFGKGNQTRGFLPLKDSIQCITIAIDNPPNLGEYRTLNQFESLHSINQLANIVHEVALELGIPSTCGPIPNPRNEVEDHYYNPHHQTLFDLGYIPTTDIKGEVKKLLLDLIPYKNRIIEKVIMPKTNWR